MTTFTDTETMYKVLGNAFQTWASHPDVASRLQEADISLRFNLNNPQGCLYLSRDGKVLFGALDMKAKVEMTLDVDTIHQCLLRTFLIASALATEKIKVRGSMAAVLKILSMLEPMYEIYPEIARSYGIST